MPNQRKAILFALSAVLFWSTAGTAFKLSLKYLEPEQLLFFAALISCLIFLLYILIRRQGNQLIHTSKKGILHSAFLGFLNPFLYYIVLLNAYNMIPAQEAVVLNYTWPLVLVVLSIPLLKQKVGIRGFIALFVSFLGTVIVVTRGDILGFNPGNTTGALMALGSALIWALFWIQNLRDSRDEANKLFWNFLFGTLYAGVYMIMSTGIRMPSFEASLGMTYIGFFEMGITFILWMMALQRSTSTAKVSNFIFLSPILSLVLIHFIVGEHIYLSSVVGLVLVLSGIWLQKHDPKTEI
ncbi:MAG: DMT family transporter [Bacteroidota bacterium]